MKEFEAILDQAEKNIGNPEELLGFVLIGSSHMPGARILDLIKLKDIFDKQQSGFPNILGLSREERRSMERQNKNKNTSSTRHKQKKHKQKRR